VLYYTVGEGGTISSTINSGVGVLPNTELTFTATPDPGYEVKEWKVNDVVVEAENILATMITAYTRVTVEFEEIPVVTHSLRITVTPSDATVTVTDSSNNVMSGTFASWNSQWTYTLPVGTYGIKVEKEGYYTHTDTQDMIGPSNHEITLEEDTTPPELVSITPSEGNYWVGKDEVVEIVITASDPNIYRFSPFEDIWFYALPDVYNGNDELRVICSERGTTVTYEGNGTWKFNLGRGESENAPGFNMNIELEDYAGNRLTDTTPKNERVNYFLVFNRLEYGPLERAIEHVQNLLDVNHYTEVSMITFCIEYDDILENMPESTQEEIEDKKDAIYAAIELLVLYIEVTQVSINEEYDTIIVEETYSLTATVLPNDATDSSVWWMVMSGPGVIDEDTGEFRATDIGEIVVKAASYSYSLINDTITFNATSPAK